VIEGVREEDAPRVDGTLVRDAHLIPDGVARIGFRVTVIVGVQLVGLGGVDGSLHLVHAGDGRIRRLAHGETDENGGDDNEQACG
jgi:hypothetical protein